MLSDEVTGKMTAGQFEIARILRQNTLRLQKLIEDLLSYHSAQFHTSALSFSQFNLKALAARVAQQHSLAMRAKNLSLNLAASEFEIEADENKIEAVIDNLLSNAIKFSPAGGTIGAVAQAGSGCGDRRHGRGARHSPPKTGAGYSSPFFRAIRSTPDR